jgi:thiol reductant ABC exporter CydC subunit
VKAAEGLGTLRTMMRVGAPPRGRLAASTALGVGAAGASIGLMACSGLLIDRAALRPPLYTLTVLMAAVQLLALARGPLRYSERLLSHDAAFGVLARLRLWLFDRLEPLAPAGLHLSRSGDLLARTTEDVDALQDLYLRGISPLVIAAVISAFAVALVAVVLPVAGLVLATCLLAGLLGPPAVALVGGRAGRREAELRGGFSAEVVDLLQGAPDLLAYGLDGDFLQQAIDTERALTDLTRRRAFAAGAVSALTIACTGAAVLGVLVVAVPAVRSHALAPEMLGILPLVALAAFEIVPPVTDAVLRLTGHLEAARRLLALDELPVPVTDPPHPLRLGAERVEPRSDSSAAGHGPVDGGERSAATTTEARPPEIVFRNVRLRYGPHLPWALDGISMRIAPGDRVAVVGPSGAGKSSLVNVLLRFWPTSGGEVTLDGVPLDALAQDEVRRTIGYLSQDAHLFDTSIRGNIMLGRPEATPDELAGVVRVAQLEAWVHELPEGLDTPVGERGTQVSGGQRQRIALARTLLANPPVLVLDEPTAGLDEPTADQLLSDVLAAAVGRTVVLVTHRTREVAILDDVVMLDGGRVVGTSGPGAEVRCP